MNGRVLGLIALTACSGTDEVVGARPSIDAAEATDAAAVRPPDCELRLPCPAPSSGRVSVCGAVYDVGSSLRRAIFPGDEQDRACDPAQPRAGGCGLVIELHDADTFRAFPAASTPLVARATRQDSCGRFAFVDVPAPPSGTLVVLIDDAPGTADAHRRTTTTVATPPGSVVGSQRGYLLRRETDGDWAFSAGLSGPSFADRGAVLVAFDHQGSPRRGVTARFLDVPDSEPRYFSDADRQRRTVAPAQTATGANGSAVLVVTSPQQLIEGVGAEPAGCVWPRRRVASAPGIVQVEHLVAQTTDGAPCP